MPFTLDNKAAEKRTKERAEEFRQEALSKTKGDDDIYSLAGLAIEMDSYKDFFSYILEKFPCFASYKNRIFEYIENRVHTKALKGEIKETTSIFTLKNNHDRKDKKEIDVNQRNIVDENELYDEKPQEPTQTGPVFADM